MPPGHTSRSAGHSPDRDHDVLIVGGGPTGLMLAGELALAGVDVAIAERRGDQTLTGSRAGGLHARSIEVLDQRGIADRFLGEGQRAQICSFGGVALDLSDAPTRHPYGLGLWQAHIERLLAAWIEELDVPVLRRCEVTDVVQSDHAAEARLGDGRRLRAAYLVGCDGARSVVRTSAGIDFPGWDATTSSLIAQAETADPPELGVRRDKRGTHGIGRAQYEIRDGAVVFADDGPVGITVTEAHPGRTRTPTLADLREELRAVYGTDFGVHSPTWISRFTDAARQAAAYRKDRVLLAGDAAHIHSPVGGQGLNLGLQDAVNLGWKLAMVVRGTSPDGLLDTYHAERHPVGARVLRVAMAQAPLTRSDARTEALRESLGELLSMDGPRRRYAAMMAGLDIRYDLGDGHPLLGRRMPDVDLVGPDGPTRVANLLHDAHPVLLNLDPSAAVDLGDWSEQIVRVDARSNGPWESPAVGEFDAPSTVLVRPDGHVAWVGTGTDVGLADALGTWVASP